MPTIDATTWQSPNHSARPAGMAIQGIVVHSCEGKPAGDEERTSLPWLVNPASKVSCHFYITRAGIIYQLVAPSRDAWGAGTSAWRNLPRRGDPGKESINCCTIQIELEHRDNSPAYTTAQLDALTWLCRQLMQQYPQITTANIASHRAVALPKGRKDDPTDWPEAEFRAWADSLNAPHIGELRDLHGIILTHVDQLDDLEDVLTAGHMPLLKVVTDWGYTWTKDAIGRVCAMTDYTIVRTLEGDATRGHPYPHAKEVLAEIAPWYAVRRGRLLIEVGNEPKDDPDGYGWQLIETIKELRKAYPRASIISTALSLNSEEPGATWMRSQNFVTACRMADFVGVHVYAHHDFDDAGQFDRAARLFAPLSDRPWIGSEIGIHDPPTPDTVKGQRYAALVRRLRAPYVGAAIYHYTTKPLDPDQTAYALGLDGAQAYGAALASWS